MGTWGDISYERMIVDKQGARVERYINHYPTPSFFHEQKEAELIKMGFEPDKEIIVEITPL